MCLYRVFPNGGGTPGLPPHQPKISSLPHQLEKSPPSPTKSQFCSIFVLISFSLDIWVMLILILIDVQYSRKAVFSFEKGLNCQNHSSSGFLHPVEKFPPIKFLIPPYSLRLFGKLNYSYKCLYI